MSMGPVGFYARTGACRHACWREIQGRQRVCRVEAHGEITASSCGERDCEERVPTFFLYDVLLGLGLAQVPNLSSPTVDAAPKGRGDVASGADNGFVPVSRFFRSVRTDKTNRKICIYLWLDVDSPKSSRGPGTGVPQCTGYQFSFHHGEPSYTLRRPGGGQGKIIAEIPSLANCFYLFQISCIHHSKRSRGSVGRIFCSRIV